jgi:putative aminopeptidase FrvX
MGLLIAKDIQNAQFLRLMGWASNFLKGKLVNLRTQSGKSVNGLIYIYIYIYTHNRPGLKNSQLCCRR